MKKRRPGRRLLVWAVGIIVVGGMLIAILLPSLCKPRETANRVKCAANLKVIGNAITLYAQDHAGQYPPSLAILITQEDLTSSNMICPSGVDEAATAPDQTGVVAELTAAETNAPGHKHCLSYVYVGGGMTTATVKENTIVAYEPLENHDGDGANVLFGDGHVEFVGKQSWPSTAAAGGLTIASSPATKP